MKFPTNAISPPTIGMKSLKKAVITDSVVSPNPYLLNRGEKVTVKVFINGTQKDPVTWTLNKNEILPVKIIRIDSIVEGNGDDLYFTWNISDKGFSSIRKAEITTKGKIMNGDEPVTVYLLNRGEKVTINVTTTREEVESSKINWTLDYDEILPVRIESLNTIITGEGELYFIW